MKIKIKLVDNTLPLPNTEKNAVCFDFYSRKELRIKSNKIKLIPTNIIISVPKGYALLIFNRSSSAWAKGLILANGVGVVDPFFNGPKDEIMLQFLNISDKTTHVKRGEKLAQGMIIKHINVKFKEVNSLNTKGRGGFVKSYKGD